MSEITAIVSLVISIINTCVTPVCILINDKYKKCEEDKKEKDIERKKEADIAAVADAKKEKLDNCMVLYGNLEKQIRHNFYDFISESKNYIDPKNMSQSLSYVFSDPNYDPNNTVYNFVYNRELINTWHEVLNKYDEIINLKTRSPDKLEIKKKYKDMNSNELGEREYIQNIITEVFKEYDVSISSVGTDIIVADSILYICMSIEKRWIYKLDTD